MINKKLLSKISVVLMVLVFGLGWSLAPVLAESEKTSEKSKAPESSQVSPAKVEDVSKTPSSPEKEDKQPTPIPTPVPAPHHEDGTEMENGGGHGEGVGEIENEGGQGTTTTATLAAQDFGVVNYDTGLGILKGYSAGFGLTNATFAGAQSVVVKLYSGATLLQTNTATAKVGMQITGAQISSPFDVLGAFDYATDGFWTNVREPEYGKTLIPTKVVATVKLSDGTELTAENSTLTGDTSIIVPAVTIPGPVISSLMSVNVASSSASVLWVTSQAANAKIWVSATSPVDVTATPAASDLTSSTFHFLNLSGLLPATTYHYIVASTNGSGGTTFSPEGTFITQ